MKEPVGEIDCPLCKRTAELHASEARTKLDPDGDGKGRPAYPKKHFIVCPPTTGYRGCGTLLMNAPGAQQRLMELGRLFGPDGKPSPKPAPAPTPAPDPEPKPAQAPEPKPKRPESSNPFKWW
ncbi:hypothetical protein JM946_12665 [Steroidobacter sp. S1-65]|uniref:Uncharacterized protein n=1 Tax=Steroidobacter gossypii TaxID=2805490 RepID=A0ABS1WXB7_9GAMM|nr:hypothetical protein [Steroidobacter gossypii]MBM0105611.1 hypothetical protein [Steroidobacter gossypii]